MNHPPYETRWRNAAEATRRAEDERRHPRTFRPVSDEELAELERQEMAAWQHLVQFTKWKSARPQEYQLWRKLQPDEDVDCWSRLPSDR